jgi:hypothetical protein
MQWNLNLQQELTPSLSAMVAYVGSRGIHQPFRVDEASTVIPTKTAAGYLFPKVDVLGNLYSAQCNATDPNATDPSTCAAPNPINTNFGSVRSMFYIGHSYYDALETQIAKRMSHGFQLQGTFTWGKSIDTSSATVAGDSFGNSISSLPWYDLRLNRGPSDFNVGRTFVLNGTWEVPTPKSFHGPTRWALGGWELGMILTASDGVPFTPGNPTNYIKSNCFSVPTAPNLAFWQANCDPAPPSVGGPVQYPLCYNLRGNAGRNIITGPGVTELDFSIFKNNYIPRISELFNVQFRAEFFNVLNHANFAPPTMPDNTDIFDGTGAPTGVAGLLSRTTTTAREIQFAIKVIF